MSQNAAVEAAVSAIDYIVGENVDMLRRRSGLSTAGLSRYFGITPSAMSLKLHGKRAWSVQDTQEAAAMFGVRMAQLVGEEKMPEPTAPASLVDLSKWRERSNANGPASEEAGPSVHPLGLEPRTHWLWDSPVLDEVVDDDRPLAVVTDINTYVPASWLVTA